MVSSSILLMASCSKCGGTIGNKDSEIICYMCGARYGESVKTDRQKPSDRKLTHDYRPECAGSARSAVKGSVHEVHRDTWIYYMGQCPICGLTKRVRSTQSFSMSVHRGK